MKNPTYAELTVALFSSWSKETSSDPGGWKPDNPAWGQCAVTALVAQDFFGGDILRASLEDVPGFSHMRSHYWNRLLNREYDFSQSQFPPDAYKAVPQGETRTREYLLSNAETKTRYELLKKNVEHHLRALK